MEAKKRLGKLAGKLMQKRCQNGHEHKISCICTNPSCEKRFLCLSCILEDSSHFNSHKKYICEITDYLKKNMIDGLEDFEQELPRKEEFTGLIQNLEDDFSDSITEIFEEIDKDYNNLKTRIIDSIDRARNSLKDKFMEEIGMRKKKLSSLKSDIEKIRDVKELEAEKEKSLRFVIDELGDSPNISNEFYFILYNFVNLNKAEKKNLKNAINEVEDYQRLYKSKKFESYGRLFQEYQKSSKIDNDNLSKIIQEFTDNSRKSQINKSFKERIDNVFKSEISANNIIKFDIGDKKGHDISTVHKNELRKEKRETNGKKVVQKKVERKEQKAIAAINPEVYEKDPKLKEVLSNPLVQNLIRSHNEESLGDLLLKNVQKKQKRQAEVMMKKRAMELETNRRLSISERINKGHVARNQQAVVPQVEARGAYNNNRNWSLADQRLRNQSLGQLNHQRELHSRQMMIERSNQFIPEKNFGVDFRRRNIVPANPVMSQRQNYVAMRSQNPQMMQEAKNNYYKKPEILMQKADRYNQEHNEQRFSTNGAAFNQQMGNFMNRKRRQIPKSQPAERTYLGKRTQLLSNHSLNDIDFKIKKKRIKISKAQMMKDRYNRELVELSNKKKSSVNSITKILNKREQLNNIQKQKKSRRFTETASKLAKSSQEGTNLRTPVLEPVDSNMRTVKKVGKRDSIVMNMAKLTKSVMKPSNKQTGYEFKISCSYDRMRSDGYSDDLLRRGKGYIFTGHSESDYIQADLEGGLKRVRKLVIEPAMVKADTEVNKQKISGAIIQVKGKDGRWNSVSSVKFGKSGIRAEIPIGREAKSVRLVHGPNMPKSASLGVGRLVIL